MRPFLLFFIRLPFIVLSALGRPRAEEVHPGRPADDTAGMPLDVTERVRGMQMADAEEWRKEEWRRRRRRRRNFKDAATWVFGAAPSIHLPPSDPHPGTD